MKKKKIPTKHNIHISMRNVHNTLKMQEHIQIEFYFIFAYFEVQINFIMFVFVLLLLLLQKVVNERLHKITRKRILFAFCYSVVK